MSADDPIVREKIWRQLLAKHALAHWKKKVAAQENSVKRQNKRRDDEKRLEAKAIALAWVKAREDKDKLLEEDRFARKAIFQKLIQEHHVLEAKQKQEKLDARAKHAQSVKDRLGREVKNRVRAECRLACFAGRCSSILVSEPFAGMCADLRRPT